MAELQPGNITRGMTLAVPAMAVRFDDDACAWLYVRLQDGGRRQNAEPLLVKLSQLRDWAGIERVALLEQLKEAVEAYDADREVGYEAVANALHAIQEVETAAAFDEATSGDPPWNHLAPATDTDPPLIRGPRS